MSEAPLVTNESRHEKVSATNLVAAVGNHEAKAILLGLMTPEHYYTAYGLQQMMKAAVAPLPTHVPAEAVPSEYCRESFIPIGFVAKMRVDEKTQYALTAEGEALGKAVAGHFLDLSLRHPEISLRRLLGMTHTAKGARSPESRYQIYKVLMDYGEPITTIELQLLTGINPNTIFAQVVQLGKDRAIRTESAPDRTIYSVNGQIPESDHKSTAASRALDQILKDIQQTPDPRFSREMLISLLRKEGLPLTEDQLTHAVDSRFRRLTKIGVVERVHERQGHAERTVWIDPKLAPVIQELCGLIERIDNDPAFVSEGHKKLTAIIGDPLSMSKLINKAMENSPQSSSLPFAEKARRIQAVLQEFGPGTAQEIVARISDKRITYRSVSKALVRMREDQNWQVDLIYENGKAPKIWAASETEAGVNT